MHGQKKRRKRTLEGSIAFEGVNLCWQLVSEPQWSTEHGYQGLCISVRTEDERHRELLLYYSYPKTKAGRPLPLPQRPKVSMKTIEADIREAIAAGWKPTSRGKSLVFYVAGTSSRETGEPTVAGAAPLRYI